jgi:predicted XRE-type DNA-binding protein
MKRKMIKIKRDYSQIEQWAKQSQTRNISRPTDPLMKLKFSICNEFNKYMVRHKLKQKELAKILEITPNKVSDLANLKLKSVSFDLIFSYLVKLSEKDFLMAELLKSFSQNPLLSEEANKEILERTIIEKVKFIEQHSEYSKEFEPYDDHYLLSA